MDGALAFLGGALALGFAAHMLMGSPLAEQAKVLGMVCAAALPVSLLKFSDSMTWK